MPRTKDPGKKGPRCLGENYLLELGGKQNARIRHKLRWPALALNLHKYPLKLPAKATPSLLESQVSRVNPRRYIKRTVVYPAKKL